MNSREELAAEVPEECVLELLGFAEDNWSDGTQTYVHNFASPGIRKFGYGLTTTIIHEVGHHLAMSHPHDGYDSELGIDYFNAGDFFFASSGDQCNSMLSYIDLNWDFSQFDRDNMARWLTATYINEANAILPKILKSPRAKKAAGQCASADLRAGQALTAYAVSDWATAAAHAKASYDQVLAAANAAGVKIEPQAHSADYKSHGKSFMTVDPISYNRFLP